MSTATLAPFTIGQPMNAYEDLQARWTPSPAQVEAADALFDADPDLKYVLSGHFLTGKEYGIWQTDVELLHADEVIAADNDSYRKAQAAVEVAAIKLAGERPGTVGYTVHRKGSQWAVFEEILSPAKVLHYAELDAAK